MNNAEYEGQIRGWDFGPDTGHYHAFVEFDGYMVPWTGEYADGLCWTTRDGARPGLRGCRGAVAIVEIDCPASTIFAGPVASLRNVTETLAPGVPPDQR